MDEAGRGPLAGPVYAACVILPEGFPIRYARDSKAMSVEQRREAERVIKAQAVAWGVGSATAREVDRWNVLQATFRAMQRALDDLRRRFPGLRDLEVLVDGNQVPPLDVPCACLVRGDAVVPEIGAASILAKTARDRFMERWAAIEPQYRFEAHKGYGTALHRSLVRLHGPGRQHRLSFLKNLLAES